MGPTKALVTGARGFIGGFLLKRLLAEGYEVTALATTEPNTQYLRDMGIQVRVGDLTRPESIRGMCQGADVVFHLAARVTYWGTRKQFYDAIFEATRNLLEESAGKVGRFVYVSSFCAGGPGGGGKHYRGHKEDDPEFPTGVFYGDAKLETEKMVYGYHRDGKVAATVVRPANVIGPGSVWVDGILETMRKMPRFPIVDGGRYSASLVDVDNLVDGILLASRSEAAPGRTYHLRDDYDVTWMRYFTDLARTAGVRLRALPLPFRAAWSLGLVSDRVLAPLGIDTHISRQIVGLIGRDNDVDTSRARQELGWRTRVPYEEAMKAVAAWLERRAPSTRSVVHPAR
ncbi:MAG: NAD-dependent epimerase/dehydratase family protein [bacterium]